MVRQPPLLLSRVIRAVAALGDPKGSSLPEIISQVQVAVDADENTDTANRESCLRKVSMQVRRAVRHATEHKLLLHRAGKYRLAARARLLPVDSLEFAASYKSRYSNAAKSRGKTTAKAIVKGKRNIEITEGCRFKKRRKQRRSKKCKRRRSRSCPKKKRRSSRKSRKSSSVCSCPSSKSKRSKSGSRSNRSRSKSGSCKRADTPMPDTAISRDENEEMKYTNDDDSSSESRHKRNSHKTDRSPFRPPAKIPSDEPPDVNDEPMDADQGQYKQSHRILHHQRHHQHQRQHQQQLQDDDKSEIDSLDEDLDRQLSY